MIEYKTVKNFTPQELERLFLSVGWFSGRFPEKLSSALKNSGHVVSAWDGPRLVGLARGLDDGVWQATIDCVLVDSGYQGRHIASELLRRLLDEYRELLYVDVMPDESRNIGFYLKQGFSVLEDGAPMQIKNDSWK